MLHGQLFSRDLLTTDSALYVISYDNSSLIVIVLFYDFFNITPSVERVSGSLLIVNLETPNFLLILLILALFL